MISCGVRPSVGRQRSCLLPLTSMRLLQFCRTNGTLVLKVFALKLRTGHAKVLQDATGASSFAQVGIASRMSLRSAPGVSNVGAKGFFMNCPLIFLRRVHHILKFMQARYAVEDIMVRQTIEMATNKRKSLCIHGFRIQNPDSLLSEAVRLHSCLRIGRLSSFLVRSMHTDDGVAIYSTTVSGLGNSKYYERSMGRVEWLVFEWLNHVLRFLQQDSSQDASWDTYWGAIQEYMQLDWTQIALGLVIAPHKFSLCDGAFRANAPGANGRSDFYLVAWDKWKKPVGKVLCSAYHTTHAAKHTWLPGSGVPNPEARILFRYRCSLEDTVKLAATFLFKSSRELDCLDERVPFVPSKAEDTIADESDDSYDEITDSESEDSMSMSEADTTLSG